MRSVEVSGDPQILLVDDDTAFCNVTSTMLRNAGYGCDCAHDAHQAGQMLREKTYDVLITDREMPGNDRFALIRNLPGECARIPVIVVTAYPTVDSAIQALQLTVIAYIVKPVEKTELLGHLAKAMELNRTRQLLESSRNRLSAWSLDLRQLEAVVQTFPGEASESARQAWFGINLDHLKNTLLELQSCVENTPQPISHGSSVPFGLRTDEQLALLQGLRETIDVLEKTKNSFKSRELGQLRKKLETLFQAGPHAAGFDR